MLASLGAIEKQDGTYRVIHDGTHGVGVNSAIRMRDQVRSPTAGDVRTAMRVLQHAHFGLTGDVSRAHRLVKVAEEDWGLQACRTGVGPVWCQQCVIPLEQTNGRTRQVSAILARQDRADAPGLCRRSPVAHQECEKRHGLHAVADFLLCASWLPLFLEEVSGWG